MLPAYPDQHLTDAQLRWIERQLDFYGSILIEPWMKRIVGVIDAGIFFTSDPSQAQFLVSLVAVGYQAIEACAGLGALEKTDYQNLRD